MICKEKISTYLCILILFAAFATGLAVTPDYGIPTDENTEIGILLSNVREYLSLYFDDESQVMYKLDEQNYLPISQTREIDHGEAAFYPLSPFLYLAKTGTIDVSRHTVSIVYHCYTYLVCFSAVVAAFVMVNDLFKNRYLALICAFIMLVSPRIFAEMHYNNKDMVLFALIADVCCLGMLAIKYCKPHQVVLFSFCSAVAANTKVIGVFAYGVVGLSFIVYTTVYKEWGDRCRIKAVISAILMFCAFYYVLTPAMWKDIPGFFDYSLFNAFRFSRWGGKVLFEGQLLSPSEGELPGRYLIKLIFLTTPLFILALSLLGAGRLIYNISGKKRLLNNFQQLLFIAMTCTCTLIPLIVASVSKATVYNGWRHFYFSYFGFLILAYYGLELLIVRWSKPAYTLSIALIAFTAILMVVNHPYQHAYYNVLAGDDTEKKYEMDFWGLSTKDAVLLAIEDDNSPDTTRIAWGADTTRLMLINAYNVLPYDTAIKIDLVYDYSSAEYIIENTTFGVKNDTQIPEDFELLTSIESYGRPITDIYVRRNA